ncbi:hypothetical protein A3728_01155 [Sulfitobacter sp. HI0040]|nr:hypothetical protein A3721_07070 [Sulfitobacter sp. HI0023]KZY22572.1 hypothetical protein A3728_01155 [Sulfitobacter sp. HI0040]KZZ65348.1 hypothetical protein A3764_00370 [Sulfitobacter sp. HI0129]
MVWRWFDSDRAKFGPLAQSRDVSRFENRAGETAPPDIALGTQFEMGNLGVLGTGVRHRV